VDSAQQICISNIDNSTIALFYISTNHVQLDIGREVYPLFIHTGGYTYPLCF